ncbi:hypothetical protein ACRHK7_01230 [Weissella tructae]|uniref:hypothetical protein n=1 Tax=Weissella tructae TaxID=887702 RepID=UPI003D8B17A5
MPNWLKGTLKLRGKKDDLIRALESIGMTKNVDEDWVDFTARVDTRLPTGHRAYVEEGTCVYLNEWNVQTVAIDNVNFAWGIVPVTAEQLKNFAEKNKLEMKFYGYESGSEFEQEFWTEGHHVVLKDIKYDDWAWESRHPNYGG